jgi:hypothetical protein
MAAAEAEHITAAAVVVVLAALRVLVALAEEPYLVEKTLRTLLPELQVAAEVVDTQRVCQHPVAARMAV